MTWWRLAVLQLKRCDQQLKAIPSWDKRINVHLTYLTPRWTINTSLMTLNISFLKKPLFKRDNGHVISRHWLPKSTARFPANKRWHSPPLPPSRGVVLGLPFPSPRVFTGRQVGGRMLTSQPKFLRSIGYQICLAMELRWQALPAGSAINAISPHFSLYTFCWAPVGRTCFKTLKTIHHWWPLS